MAKAQIKENKYQLPLGQIKVDLIKMTIYAVFALVFLGMLSIGDVTFSDVASLFRFVPLHL